MDDVMALSALEQARLVQEGRVGAEELARAYLTRIDAINPRLGAFVAVGHRGALAAARRIDSERRRPDSARGPLYGLPTAIKDLNFVRGLPMRAGSRSLRFLVWSPIDDAVARRVRRAGLVILGKLATSELGILPTCETEVHPPARNPHALDRTAGGSSGGSGAAVGGRLLALAHGSDAAGSIRIPAALCGVIGMKPSRGALVSPHAHLDVAGIAVEGPLARTVLDAAAFMDLLRASPGESYLVRAQTPPPRLTIAYASRSPDVEVTAEVRAQVERAAAALAALGHRVEERPVERGEVDEFLPIMQHMTRAAPMPFTSKLQPMSRWMRSEGARHDRAAVARRAAALEARVVQWFGDADAWLLPTVAVETPKLGAFAGLEPRTMFHAVAALGRLTAPFNVSGMPAISLPAGRGAGGLPVGVQLAMRRGEDGLLLSLARELEQSGFCPPLPPVIA